MSSEGIRSYEKPAIETIPVADLVEMIGPAQGYGIGGNQDLLSTPLSNSDNGGARHLGR